MLRLAGKPASASDALDAVPGRASGMGEGDSSPGLRFSSDRREKMAIRPGVISTTSPGLKTAYGLHLNCVVTSPDIEEPHSPYASPMRSWSTSSQKGLNP